MTASTTVKEARAEKVRSSDSKNEPTKSRTKERAAKEAASVIFFVFLRILFGFIIDKPTLSV